MKLKRGTSRTVFIFPFFGIAIKFPRIYMRAAIRETRYALRHGGWKQLKLMYSYSAELTVGIKGLLFKGIVSNWKEFCFYQRTHHIFCQPTYFSLFGFLNIQRVDVPCLIKDWDLWCQLHELTKGAVWVDSHHFHNAGNFCFHNGKLRMLDYGSVRSRKVVYLHGETIFQRFNPAYSWEEEKAKQRLSTQEVS